MPSLLNLPTELHILLFSHLGSFKDLQSLLLVCHQLHNVFSQNPITILNPVAHRTLPAFPDALRAIRARNLPESERCFYDSTRNEYINIPSATFCRNLSHRKATLPELKAVLQLAGLVQSWRDVEHYKTSPYAWWSRHHTTAEESISSALSDWLGEPRPRISGGPAGIKWTAELEERYRRGAYRMLLMGYLFGAGVFCKPIRELAEEVIETGGVATQRLLGYPAFDWVDAERRMRSLNAVAAGFWEWVSDEGERNAPVGVKTAVYFYSDDGMEGVQKVLNSIEYAGLREILLIHSIHRFMQWTYEPLAEFREPLEEESSPRCFDIDTYMPYLQRRTIYRVPASPMAPKVGRPSSHLDLVMRNIESGAAFSFANTFQPNSAPFEALVTTGLRQRYGLKIPERPLSREYYWGFVDGGELPLVVAE